jgi:hypothetical protein
MKVSEILLIEEMMPEEASTESTESSEQESTVRTKRGFMVWYEQGDGLRKYVIAKLSQGREVVDIHSTVTSRNGIKQLYSRKQAKAIAEIISKEHPGVEPRIIKASMEKYEDGTVSVNVG